MFTSSRYSVKSFGYGPIGSSPIGFGPSGLSLFGNSRYEHGFPPCPTIILKSEDDETAEKAAADKAGADKAAAEKAAADKAAAEKAATDKAATDKAAAEKATAEKATAEKAAADKAAADKAAADKAAAEKAAAAEEKDRLLAEQLQESQVVSDHKLALELSANLIETSNTQLAEEWSPIKQQSKKSKQPAKVKIPTVHAPNQQQKAAVSSNTSDLRYSLPQSKIPVNIRFNKKGELCIGEEILSVADLQKLGTAIIWFTGPNGLAPDNQQFNYYWKFNPNFLIPIKIDYVKNHRYHPFIGNLEYDEKGHAFVKIIFDYNGVKCIKENSEIFLKKMEKITAGIRENIKEIPKKSERTLFSAEDALDEMPPCWFGSTCKNKSCIFKH